MRGHFQAIHLSKRWPITLVTERGVFEVVEGQFTQRKCNTAPELDSRSAFLRSLLTRKHYLYEKYNCRHWNVPDLGQFTHVIVHYSALLHFLKMDHTSTPAIIFDTHNNEREYFESVAAETRNRVRAFAIRNEAKVAERLIHKRARRIAATVSVSESDRAWVMPLCTRETKHFVVPNNLFQYLPTVWTGSKTILFVGTLSVTMNLQALDWFLVNVWPAIQRARTDIRFVVAGRDPAPEVVSGLRSRGVIVVANALSLRNLYAEAMFAVVPALSGSGAKIKVAEALSFGVPVITTPRGLVGQPAAIQACCVVEEDAPAWIEAILAQARLDCRSTQDWDVQVRDSLEASYFGSSIAQIATFIESGA